MKVEQILKEHELTSFGMRKSDDLTEMMKWKGIKKNDVLYSPIFGDVVLLSIESNEPKIIVKDSVQGIHRFDSHGRLDGLGSIMLFPDNKKVWSHYEKITSKVPNKEDLMKKENKAIKTFSEDFYKLKLTSQLIDDFFENFYDYNDGFIRYVFCTVLNKCDDEMSKQPLSCGRANLIKGVGLNRVDKSTYVPTFKLKNNEIRAEIDLFEFKSVSSAVYFYKTFKGELKAFYSEYKMMNYAMQLYSEIFGGYYSGYGYQFKDFEKSDDLVFHLFYKDIIIENSYHKKPRQRVLDNREYVMNRTSSDLIKMMDWMGYKSGQSLYSPAFGYLKLLSINETEPRIKTIDNRNMIREFTSEGKYCNGGEVILFPERGEIWKSPKKKLVLPQKNELETKNENNLKTLCHLLYKLIVSAVQLDDFFYPFMSSFMDNNYYYLTKKIYYCTFLFYNKDSKYYAECKWTEPYASDSHNEFELSNLKLFQFKSYSALYYFIKYFKSEIELLYSGLFGIQISGWDLPQKLPLP